MKGAVYIALNQMIEEHLGMTTWEEVLDTVNPASEGAYTSIEEYPDEELFALVKALSDISGKSEAELVGAFGEYLFGFLDQKYPYFSASEPTFFGFLKSIDGVIHQEVRKLYSSELPSIDCQDVDEHTLNMYYHSPRKLCILAEGLVRGAASHYGENISLSHPECMHKGQDKCLISITLDQ